MTSLKRGVRLSGGAVYDREGTGRSPLGGSLQDLVTVSRPVVVSATAREAAYDLFISEVHTYHVGTDAVLVHNTCGAAMPAIGFAEDAVGSAYVGMIKEGGHAVRHLREEGLISNACSLASQVDEFQTLTSPILKSPTKAFDWRIGNTMSRAFVGAAGGRPVVVFVGMEGAYQGRVISAYTINASRMAQWGLA